MEASFIEVYNETLRDLLAEGRNPRDASKVLDNNAIKHMADGMPFLEISALTEPFCAIHAAKRHSSRQCQHYILCEYKALI